MEEKSIPWTQKAKPVPIHTAEDPQFLADRVATYDRIQVYAERLSKNLTTLPGYNLDDGVKSASWQTTPMDIAKQINSLAKKCVVAENARRTI